MITYANSPLSDAKRDISAISWARAASSAQRCGAAALRILSLALARFRRIPLARLSFFAPFTPALWEQLGLWPSACRTSGRGGVVTGTALGTALGTPKPLRLLDIPRPLPRYHSPPAHVIRSRARACASSPLSMVTWEQRYISYVGQRLGALPRPFPPSPRVGTWEQAQAVAPAPDRLRARSNKVEAGNGDLQRAGVGAGEKFRGSIARSAGVDQVEIERIRQLPTRRGGNGGFRPLSACLGGRVGRPGLEGSAQGAGNAGDLAGRPKLGRLRGRALGELAGQLLELGLVAGAAADRPGEAPGAPNRARAIPGMLALHGGGVWIEGRFSAAELARRCVEAHLVAVSVGDYSDRCLDSRKNAQTGDRSRGPGGAALWIAARGRSEFAKRDGGPRAGVNCLRLVARLHAAGEIAKLRRDRAAVNGARA